MASRRPAKQFPLQCPSPWCGKGFNDVPQIQKHISMSARCGMYLQKLLHAQSQTFGIPSPTTGSPQSISNINNPFAAADVCFPINHHEPDNLPADEDGLIMDESTTVHSEADSETNTHNLPIQTIECHTNEQYFECKLLKILNDVNAPHYLFKSIMDWAQEASRSGYTFQPKQSTRKAHIQYLKSWLNLPESSFPKQIPTLLPNLPEKPEQTINVTTFNFTAQLHSLLFDSNLFLDLTNLDVNLMNPFGKYENSLCKLSTINSGQQYHESYATMIQNPDTDFLMPIIFSCDETKISSMGRTSCWPLMFTTTILNQSCHNKPEAWKPLGYVHDLSLAMSQAEEKQLGNDLKYTRLHRVFKTILKSYVDAQHSNALQLDLEIRQKM